VFGNAGSFLIIHLFKEPFFNSTFVILEFHCHFDWMLFTPLHAHITNLAPGLPSWCPVSKSL